jgi:hypothetical protein
MFSSDSSLLAWTISVASNGELSLRLLRLDLLDRTAGVAPGGESAGHMRNRLQPHVLRGFGRQRRAQSAGTIKDELLVALENRLRIGARRINPEFQHAAGAGERAGDSPLTLDLAGIADIDDHDVIALRGLDGIDRADRLDLRVGLVDQGLDAAMDGLGHWITTSQFRHSGMVRRRRPVISKFSDMQLHIQGSRCARPGITTVT